LCGLSILEVILPELGDLLRFQILDIAALLSLPYLSSSDSWSLPPATWHLSDAVLLLFLLVSLHVAHECLALIIFLLPNGMEISYFFRTVDEVIEGDLLDLIGEIPDLCTFH
jgi:hypothetical protein